jgi:hypothetical protein
MGRATLDELADAAGRAASSLEITAYSQEGDPDTLKRFEDSGASRITVRLPTTAGETALTELERMAARLFS